MEYRPLGRTGVHVSKLCLGNMMFGAWGNADHDDSIRIIHRALDAGVNFLDTADVYSAGESEEIVGKALKGRRDDVVLATQAGRPDGRRPEPPRRFAPLDHHRSRELAAPPGHRLDRPLPASPPRPAHRHRRDARGAHRPRPPGQDPLHRLVLILRRRDRRGAVGGTRKTPRTLPQPNSRRTRSWSAASNSTSCRRRPATAWGSSPTARSAGNWLSGRWRADSSPTSAARQRLVARFDMTLPENQRKLEAAHRLAEVADQAGVSLIELAIAFVINHPAVTSAIIGPRTMDQLDSQLPAAELALDPAILDRIDEIVRPGVNLNPADTSYGEQVLKHPSGGGEWHAPAPVAQEASWPPPDAATPRTTLGPLPLAAPYAQARHLGAGPGACR